MADRLDAVIVGSGPNGLAAAVILAAAGLSVEVLESQPDPGGGCRTVELDLGVRLPHDLCSAVHPMAVASPFFERFGLTRRGVELLVPEASYAHPLESGAAGVAYPSIDRTVAELAEHDPNDGRLWRMMMQPLAEAGATVRDIGLSDIRHVPPKVLTPWGVVAPIRLAARTLGLGTSVWDRLISSRRASALLTGVAAHANTTIPSVAGAATALLLATLAHTHGWPIPVGGSQAITDALVDDLRTRGVTIRSGCHISDADQLPSARAYVFDTSPWALATVFGARMPATYRHALQSFRPGNGVAKVDFVISEPVPWADARVGRAGTVHIGGSRAAMESAEKQTAAGQHAERPLILVSQPTVVDKSRLGPHGEAPLWSYAHVPNGSPRDMTAVVAEQIERFAPGFRDVVLSSRCIPAGEMHRHNPNYVGGDIAVGQVSMYRMLARPALKWDPYRTPLGNVYLCSAATPPGPGVHGMSGMHAATRVLQQQFGIHTFPDIGPAA